MKQLLDDEEKEEFLKAMKNAYEAFKVNNEWNLSEEMESNWREGVSDVFDAIVQASRRLTYDASTLRSELEFMFDEMDNKE